MIMTNFLKNRKSVREFKNKKVDVKILDEVKLYLKTLEKEESNGNLKFSMYEYGEKIYDDLKGVGGYSGVMIQSPHYIELELINNQEESMIYGGYYMEKLISMLNKLGLDTCWISIVDVNKETKKEVLGERVGEVNYLLAIGYSKPRNPFIAESFSERIGVEEIVFNEEIGKPIDMNDLENRGLSDLFYYVRFAPSTKNKQPWRFVIEDHKVILLLENKKGEELNLMDAGIIMYYFEALAETIGINSKWNLLNKVETDEDCNYKYIAELNL